MTLSIERVFEQSHIRRGRLATDPTWFVQTTRWRYRFMRKRDAQRFIDAGGECPEHKSGCSKCNGIRYDMPASGEEKP